MDDSADSARLNFSVDGLAQLDQSPLEVVEAIKYGRPPPSDTHATPHCFVCDDGKSYWLKAQAQNGLAAELISGRLAELARAGPNAKIVTVEAQVLTNDTSAHRFNGSVVGIEDRPGTFNSKDLPRLIQSGSIPALKIDPAARARVVAFQTWIGTSGDPQVLVNPVNGLVHSVDHGHVFGDLSQSAPNLVVTPIHGVDDSYGNSVDDVDLAVSIIESISDEEILKAVARVYQGNGWNADRTRRFEIAKWLSARRDQLRKVMQQWK